MLRSLTFSLHGMSRQSIVKCVGPEWHCTVCAMLPSPTKINKTHGRDGGTGVLSTVFYVLMCHDNSKIQD